MRYTQVRAQKINYILDASYRSKIYFIAFTKILSAKITTYAMTQKEVGLL